MKKERNFSYDFLRIAACFLIVLTHANPLVTSEADFCNFMTIITSPGIHLFFMLSGALILPVPHSMIPFYKNKLLRIGVPLVLWNCIYMAIFIANKYSLLEVSWIGHGTLGFLFALLGLYFLVPLIQPFLLSAKKLELDCFIFTWFIVLLYPVLECVLPFGVVVAKSIFILLDPLGYFILGFYLTRYKLPMYPAIFIIIIAIILYPLDKDTITSLFWSSSIVNVSVCLVSWYAILWTARKLKGTVNRKVVACLSQLTFGIYLVHYLIERELLLKLPPFSSIESLWVKTLVLGCLSFVISALLVYILEKIPFLRAFVGFRYRERETGILA